MRFFALFCSIILLFSCSEDVSNDTVVFGTSDLNYANRTLLEIAMEDGFPPPVASRVYVYPHIAHYITLQSFYPDSLKYISNKLNGLESLPEMDKSNVNAELAALLAFCKIGRKVVFSEFYMDDLAEEFKDKARKEALSENIIFASERYASEVASHLSIWIDEDMYIQTRTFDRFTSTKKPQNWRETPPDYIEALEPFWNRIRPLVIDSASIFVANPPPAYETSKDSEFYKMVYEVYEESKNLDSLKIATTWFWDDNPNTTIHQGHMVAVIHKISPPGHWLNIIHQITEFEDSSLFTTSKAYTFTATAMFDAIISCWHEKFKTDLVRPITYIQEYINVSWRPVIQTPPFPEYTSGHSAISASAAGVLNSVFGKDYSFYDNTNELFNAGIRNYSSFDEAAWEVSLSRFYGGIHYMIGVQEGNRQGYFIANHILEKFNQN
jgi:hypothetical protein